MTKAKDEVLYSFSVEDGFRIRKYMGKLIGPKKKEKVAIIAERIDSMNVDVLAIQEAENIDTLKAFNRENLKKPYKYEGLIEGNDDRLIDIGILSNYPIGAMTSWQHAIHPSVPGEKVFARDLLEIEILDESRQRILFRLFINHLKSQYVPYGEDPLEGKKQNDQRRARQAETINKIVQARTRPNDRFIILGDMNDSPDSPYLAGFATDATLDLVNALANPKESRPAPHDDVAPTTKAWTHRFKPTGQPAKYELYDKIWISRALSAQLLDATIERRKNLTGDGSDHDPAWVRISF